MNDIFHHLSFVLTPHFLLVIKSSQIFIRWVCFKISLKSTKILDVDKINKIYCQAINHIAWHYRYAGEKVFLKLSLINLGVSSYFLLSKAFILTNLAYLKFNVFSLVLFRLLLSRILIQSITE